MLYGAGVFLLGAIGGYWMLERADNHKGSLKRVGQWLGAFLIIVSLLGLVSTFCKASGMKGGMCPLFPKSYAPMAPPGR